MIYHEMKTLLYKLDKEIDEMYNVFLNDEDLHNALFHLGAMRSLVTWQMEKNGLVNDKNKDSDQNNLGAEPTLCRALEQKEQTQEAAAASNHPVSESILAISASRKGDSLQDCAQEAGLRQFRSILQDE